MTPQLLHLALFEWPFLALAGALFGTAALVVWPRAQGTPPRWRDPEWLVCLMLPAYMLHQFEEHGFNLLGQRYHFLTELCGALGHPDVGQCPASPAFVLAVNVGVWIPGVFAILERRRNLMVGACALGVPLMNAVAHIGQAVATGRYNSGLLTAAVVFLPFTLWTLAQLRRVGVLNFRRLVAVVASGVVLHVVLIGSVLAHGAGLLPKAGLLLINFCNGFVPVGFGVLARASQPVESTSSNP